MVLIKGIPQAEWKKLSDKIRKRDKYTCQECGDKNRILHVHHISPYKTPKDNKSKNLITLCVKCHATKHSNKRILEAIRKFENYDDVGPIIKDSTLLKPCKIPRIEDYTPPRWHLWVYGGGKRPE